jgi:diadenosine tetraphosphate (Ap4A) HIT family hydrolase
MVRRVVLRTFSILKKLQEMLVSVGLVVVENSRAIVPHRSNTATKIGNMALSPHFHYHLIWRRTMNYSKLFEVGKPPFFTLVIDTASLDSLYLQLFDKYKGAIIRMIRGNKSKTTPDFFNEVAAALQFPYYFGENWDAFNDCIKDFHTKWVEKFTGM